MPSASTGVQLAVPPLATPETAPLATTVKQTGSEHTWKLTVPVSPASGSPKVAASAGELVCVPSAGVWRVGSFGKVDAAGCVICARLS